VHDLADRWRLGLGLFSLSGASLDPSDGWTGRNQVTEISLLTVSIAPTVAYQLTDRLSVGGGPVIWYGLLDLKVRAPVLAEPTIKIEDADDWEVGWMAGALFEVNDRLRFGAQYLSEANLELSGDIKIPAGGVAANVDMEMDLAQLVAVSMYWDVTDRVALLMTADWEDWSTLSKIPVSVSSGSNDVPTGWGDTWKVGVGVNYQWRPDWMLQAGYSYDSSPVKSRDRNAMLPVDRQHRYAVGAQYQWSENTNVGFSVEYIDLGSSQIRASNLVGDYEDNQLWAFVGTVSWHRLPWDGHLRFGKKDWEK
jgi:long-chain fatty acid transport protein